MLHSSYWWKEMSLSRSLNGNSEDQVGTCLLISQIQQHWVPGPPGEWTEGHDQFSVPFLDNISCCLWWMRNLRLPASPTRTFHAFSSTITHIWKWNIQNDRHQKISNHHEMTGCTFSILQINNGSRRKLFHLMICLFFDHSCTSGQYCDSSLLYIAISILFLIDLFLFASI